jgi:hypothetical protein
MLATTCRNSSNVANRHGACSSLSNMSLCTSCKIFKLGVVVWLYCIEVEFDHARQMTDRAVRGAPLLLSTLALCTGQAQNVEQTLRGVGRTLAFGNRSARQTGFRLRWTVNAKADSQKNSALSLSGDKASNC